MIIIGAVKAILIFPFIIYFLLYFMTKSEKQSFLLAAPIYLVSLALILRYLFGLTMGIVTFIVVLLGLLYITIELSRQKKGLIGHFIRTFFVTTGRFYPPIYILLIILGVIQEYIRIR